MIYTHLAAALAGAAISGAAVWQYHRAEMNEREIDISRSVVRALENQAAETTRMQEQKDEALKQSAARQRSLAADVARGRDVLVRLSDAAGAAIREAQDSHGACIEKVDAFADVFGQCRVRLREVGEAADDHAEDARKLNEAWPQN